MSSISPAKRKLSQLINGTPQYKSTVTRRDVKVYAAVVGKYKETAIFYCKTSRGDDIEPYTFPARKTVLQDNDNNNALRSIGILFLNNRVPNEASNDVFLTNRGYAYNAFVVYSDNNLTDNDFEHLRCILNKFTHVSTKFLYLY